MRPMTLLLVHGWGFDAGFWEPLRRALPEHEAVAVDFGFTGRPRMPEPPSGPVVGIGHSLGFAWLLRQEFDFAGLVAINGFARFTKAADFPHGTHVRVLERMRARFAEAPEAVHRDFMRRCGICNAAADGLDHARLAEGLGWLADWDARARLRGPLLALAGGADAIVPEAMAREMFPEADLRWRPGANHLLPVSEPEWCAAEIRAFLAGLP